MTVHRRATGIDSLMRARVDHLSPGRTYRLRDLASNWHVTEQQARNYATRMRAAGLLRSRPAPDDTSERIYALTEQEAA